MHIRGIPGSACVRAAASAMIPRGGIFIKPGSGDSQLMMPKSAAASMQGRQCAGTLRACGVPCIGLRESPGACVEDGCSAHLLCPRDPLCWRWQPWYCCYRLCVVLCIVWPLQNSFSLKGRAWTCSSAWLSAAQSQQTCTARCRAPLAHIDMQLILARRWLCITLYLVQSICGSAAELLLQSR